MVEALLIDALADPIPARPGWVAELWIEGELPDLLGVYQPKAGRRGAP
jgi:hypothetical protein